MPHWRAGWCWLPALVVLPREVVYPSVISLSDGTA